MGGVYTEITDIIAPDTAPAGSVVNVTIKVKNTWNRAITVMVNGRIKDGPQLDFNGGFSIQDIQPLQSKSFPCSFTMPSSDALIYANSLYLQEDGSWKFDDGAEKLVALAEAVEPYYGTISRMELEYDGARASIPAYNIPQGKRGLVHIWGRNNMDEAQRMGISWVVFDPDGIRVEEYSAWEAWPYTGAGDEHEFIGGRFNLDKPGTYIISITLTMNPSDPEIVDTYYGFLCTVAAMVPEPEFRGFGVSEYTKV